jgi:hypothetical protein
VLLALVYFLLRRAIRLIARSSDERMHTEAELVVLRHQLMVRGTEIVTPRLSSVVG